MPKSLKIIKHLLIFIAFAAKAQTECLIAISNKDCSSCLTILPKINKINALLNPIIILDMDSNDAEFFVRNYLKIKSVPYRIDKTTHQSLTFVNEKGNISYLTSLFIDGEKRMQFLTNKIDVFIDSLNTYSESPILDALTNLNQIIDSKHFGRIRFNINGDNYSISSEFNPSITYGSFKNGKIKEFIINDSTILNTLFSQQLKDSNFIKKYRSYQIILEDNDVVNINFQIHDHAFYNKKLYVYLTTINWDSLPSVQEVYSSGELKLRFKRQLLEIEVDIYSNNPYKILQSWDSNVEDKMPIEYRLQFSIINNIPAWVYRDKNPINRKYYYKTLDFSQKGEIPVINENLFRFYLLENNFTESAVLTYDYNLINLSSKTVFDVYKYNKKNDSERPNLGGFCNFDSFICILFFPSNKNVNTCRLVILDKKTNSLEKSIDINYPINNNMQGKMYFDSNSNSLYIIAMNEKKQLSIVNTIKLSKL